ncbi:MAG: SMI1/KNR4 family protein [Janthinobacterium lividum]
MEYFKDVDLMNFWDDDEYALRTYVSAAPSPELIASLEAELGYKLPASYIGLMQERNGGVPRNTCFPTTEPTSCADDHVVISGILGIGRTKANSLGGEFGSQFMIEEWGYPDLGVYICDCPSAGHDMILLDYSACGPTGEPTVAHVGQEDDYQLTFLAKDFETFIRGLVSEDVYDTSAEDLQLDLAHVATGSLSPLLATLVNQQPTQQYERILRTICGKITTEKGHFSLHADELSTLVYDLQFLLYTQHQPSVTLAEYLEAYPEMLVFGVGEFRTGGYGPSFLTDWATRRQQQGWLVQNAQGAVGFTPAYQAELARQLSHYA